MTDLTKQIRKEIKDSGYTNKQVSLKENNCSLNWSYDMTIKDESINPQDLYSIRNKFQSIDRDSSSGEILNGANIYFSIIKDGRLF